jgi:hypothetical protein|tara:strand:- start:2859 stop:4079 length:1221 start_codon:yes stop_codon:yes gene_type:complete
MIEKKQIFSLGENKLTTDYEIVLDLGKQPWANGFLKEDECGKEPIYPLQLVYCNKSELLQLSYFVPKETMFLNHTYISGTTKTLIDHFYKLAVENNDQYNLDKENDIILDIGGNDGSQLEQYKKLGFKELINFESATNICTLSEEKGLKTINNFFNEENVKEKLEPNSVKLINASGVFFHLEELDSVIKGINYCLKDDGVFVAQCMYVGAMVDNLNFDTIYHEHLCYYTLNSLTKLLKKYNLYLEDAYFDEIHSGSIICKFRKNKCKTTKRTKILEERDKKYTLDSFKEFGKKINNVVSDLKQLLIKEKSLGKKIWGYGAPVKGNTLLNYMKVDSNLIEKIVEVNPYKIGTYAPGSHIPVIKETKTNFPDCYLLLSHNFEKEILEKNKEIINKGTKFIIPFSQTKS